MKYLVIFFSLLSIAFSASAQQLEVGGGITLNEHTYYESPIDLDTLVIYERTQQSSHLLFPSVTYSHMLHQLFAVNMGVQYYRDYAGMVIEKRATDSSNVNSKLTGAGIRSLALPISASFKFTEGSHFKLEAFAGIIPVFNRIKFDPRFKPGPDYPASIAEGLNKAGTLPKRFHMDYLVGGRLSYWRLNLDVYYQSNITGNLNNNLEVWGHEFLFRRRTESVRLLLSYSVPLGVKD